MDHANDTAMLHDSELQSTNVVSDIKKHGKRIYSQFDPGNLLLGLRLSEGNNLPDNYFCQPLSIFKRQHYTT